MKMKSVDNGYVTIAILLIGVMLGIFQSFKNAGITIEALITPVDHPITFHSDKYAALLKKYVHADLVDYEALKKGPELRSAVDEIKHTSSDKIVNEADQLAYWINCYNLLVLELVCDKYPLHTMRQIGNDYSGKMFLVGGKPYAAQDVYVGQLYPRLKQGHATAIFLVSQGAIGYPPLQDHPYDKDNVKQESEKAAHKFINNKHNVFYDVDAKTLKVTPFFQWTQDLYSTQWANPFTMVNSYLNNKVDFNDEGVSRTFLLPFDWRLNDTKNAPSGS
jgi:hypothetical protein